MKRSNLTWITASVLILLTLALGIAAAQTAKIAKTPSALYGHGQLPLKLATDCLMISCLAPERTMAKAKAKRDAVIAEVARRGAKVEIAELRRILEASQQSYEGSRAASLYAYSRRLDLVSGSEIRDLDSI